MERSLQQHNIKELLPNRISAVDLVKKRIEENSLPGQRDDFFKVGFVFEGGAMKAVRSCGMVIAFEAVNGFRAADSVYATSGGVGPALYGIGENMAVNMASAWEELNTKDYVDFARLRHGNSLNLNFLMEVLSERRPIDWEKIRDSKIDLQIMVTEANSATTVALKDFKSRDELLKACSYACHLPIAAGMPVQITEDRYYTDGGLIAGGIPLQKAIDDGCTHIVCFLNSRKGEAYAKRTPLEPLLSFYLKRKFPKLAKSLPLGVTNYNRATEMIEASQNGDSSVPIIDSVCVGKNATKISLLEKDERVLVAATLDGYIAAREKFEFKRTFVTKLRS